MDTFCPLLPLFNNIIYNNIIYSIVYTQVNEATNSPKNFLASFVQKCPQNHCSRRSRAIFLVDTFYNCYLITSKRPGQRGCFVTTKTGKNGQNRAEKRSETSFRGFRWHLIRQNFSIFGTLFTISLQFVGCIRHVIFSSRIMKGNDALTKGDAMSYVTKMNGEKLKRNLSDRLTSFGEWYEDLPGISQAIVGLGAMGIGMSAVGFAYHFSIGMADTITYWIRHR